MDLWTNLFSTLYIKDVLVNSALTKEFHCLADFIKQISFVNTAIFCCTIWIKERYAYRYTKLNFFAPKKYCELTVFLRIPYANVNTLLKVGVANAEI